MIDGNAKLLADARKVGDQTRQPVESRKYSTLKPSTTPILRTKGVNKRANKTAKRRDAKLLYRDSFGVGFLESRRWLNAPSGQWSSLFPFKLLPNPAVCRLAHRLAHGEDEYGRCWLCPQGAPEVELEAHHVVPRFDFIGNICMCCAKDHRRVQDNPEALREVLLACWKNNKLCFSWVFLVRARGSWWPFDDLD
jgi:hypothetical protein